MNRIIIIIFNKLIEVWRINPAAILVLLAFTGYVTIPLYFYYLFITGNNSYSNDSYEHMYEDDESSYSYVKTDMQKYYDILGCSSDDDFSSIKEAYMKIKAVQLAT